MVPALGWSALPKQAYRCMDRLTDSSGHKGHRAMLMPHMLFTASRIKDPHQTPHAATLKLSQHTVVARLHVFLLNRCCSAALKQSRRGPHIPGKGPYICTNTTAPHTSAPSRVASNATSGQACRSSASLHQHRGKQGLATSCLVSRPHLLKHA